MLIHSLKTTIAELKILINDAKCQLKRLRVSNTDDYPITINIRNESHLIDDWRFDINDDDDS